MFLCHFLETGIYSSYLTKIQARVFYFLSSLQHLKLILYLCVMYTYWTGFISFLFAVTMHKKQTNMFSYSRASN